jgi:hypothetical protein
MPLSDNNKRVVQWALLNGITNNGINQIIESLFSTFSQSNQLYNRQAFSLEKRNSVNSINNFLGSDMVWSKAIPKKAAPTVFYSLPNLMVHRQISMMHRQILKFNKTVGTS